VNQVGVSKLAPHPRRDWLREGRTRRTISRTLLCSTLRIPTRYAKKHCARLPVGCRVAFACGVGGHRLFDLAITAAPFLNPNSADPDPIRIVEIRNAGLAGLSLCPERASTWSAGDAGLQDSSASQRGIAGLLLHRDRPRRGPETSRHRILKWPFLRARKTGVFDKRAQSG
jgi:hypothetical protein